MSNLGVTAILASTLSLDANSSYVQRGQCVATEKLVGAWIYCSADAGGTAPFKINVYDKAAADYYPEDVIATSAELAVPASASWAWRYVAFASEPTLTSGAYYYFGPHTSSNRLNIRYATTGGQNYEQGDTYSDGPEDPWAPAGGGGPGTRQYSCYLVTEPLNSAPNAPSLTYPIGGVVVNRDGPVTFTWAFSDPDSGDTQSAYDVRYRVVGDPTWISLGWQTSANSEHTFAAATFTAGQNYEWQAATKDNHGAAGTWSSSAYYTAQATPATPTLDEPDPLDTIAAPTSTLQWTVTNQDAYQARSVADSAGSPDTNTVYTDTGEVVSTSARTCLLAFPVNGRVEHVQLRVKYLGIWSAWATAKVTVSWTGPAKPVCSVVPQTTPGCIRVGCLYFSPGGSYPAPTSYDVFRSEDAGATYIRIAKDLDPDERYDDYAVGSGVEYHYYVRAKATNGTFTDSDIEIDGYHPDNWDDIVAAGLATEITPSTDTGFQVYSNPGRFFGPALTNGFTNPGFRTDTNADGQADGLSLGGGPVAGLAWSLAGGQQRIMAGYTAGDGATWYLRSDHIAGYSAGDQATFQMEILSKTVLGCTPQISIQAYDAVNGFLGVSSGTVPASGVGSHTWVLPANTAKIRVALLVTDWGTGDILDITFTNWCVTKSAYRAPYFDGSSPGASWTGTPDASTSTMPASSLVLSVPLGTTAYTAALRYSAKWAHNDGLQWYLARLWTASHNRSSLVKNASNQLELWATDGTHSVNAQSTAQTLAPDTVNHLVTRLEWNHAAELNLNGTDATDGDATLVDPQDLITVKLDGQIYAYIGPVVISAERKSDAWVADVQAGSGGAYAEPIGLFFNHLEPGDIIIPLTSSGKAYLKL
jgi:hypothetical protein